MKTKPIFFIVFFILLQFLSSLKVINGQEKFTINDLGYFESPGFDVMVFDDYYPNGHQSGVTIIQNGVRVAANGDIRFGRYPEKASKKSRQICRLN